MAIYIASVHEHTTHPSALRHDRLLHAALVKLPDRRIHNHAGCRGREPQTIASDRSLAQHRRSGKSLLSLYHHPTAYPAQRRSLRARLEAELPSTGTTTFGASHPPALCYTSRSRARQRSQRSTVQDTGRGSGRASARVAYGQSSSLLTLCSPARQRSSLVSHLTSRNTIY